MSAVHRRPDLIHRLSQAGPWDVAVVGGGATGLGIALDAAARGNSVVLLERGDFAKGTSSRATKLLHGGVRYLAQGNVKLVREALRERTTILGNAPHLAAALPFVIPVYSTWHRLFYGVGLTLYDLLAGRHSLGRTRLLTVAETVHALPTINTQGLVGGIRYWDAQFDDARLAVALARTGAEHGALLLNYCDVFKLRRTGGKVSGLLCRDAETGTVHELSARCVINATGVWVDDLRAQDAVSRTESFDPLVSPSQGVHLVVDGSYLPGGQALMIPKTEDGRVLFAVPWLGKVVIGTTDTATDARDVEPMATDDELEFLITEANKYLRKKLTRTNVQSVWVGLRPLVSAGGRRQDSKSISREHTIEVSAAGLVTVTGGKWTTYRAIAEHVLDRCCEAGLVPVRRNCATGSMSLVGAAPLNSGMHSGAPSYGADLADVQAMPGADDDLGGGLTQAMVRFAARCEYARTVEDVLARRSRLLFLNARFAASVAQRVADILYSETRVDPKLWEFLRLCERYSLVSAPKPGPLGGGTFYPEAVA